MLNDLLIRLRAIFRRQAVERELDDELRFHFEQQVAKLEQSGVSEEEARRQAHLSLGGTEQIKEECRDAWGVRVFETLAQDVRYAGRTLRKSPGFTGVAIATLALGIGINTALFTIVNHVLMRPLPFAHPERLVSLWERNVIGETDYNVVSGGIFGDWQEQAASFEQMAAIGEDSANLSGDGGALPESVGTRQCSFNLFSMLGVQPLAGRFFAEGEDRSGASATTVLTYGLWKRRYAADPGIVGKTVLLDSRPYTVIGVLPAWFDYPDTRTQLWLPVRHEVSAGDMRSRSNHRFFVTARLKPGVSVAQASAELDAIQQRIHKQFPDTLVGKGVNVLPLSDNLVRDVKPSLYALVGAVVCVLLIACLNVASLFVARVTTRGRELAIRGALGGSRWRLVQAQLAESFVLTMAGGALGALLAWASVKWLVAFRADLPHAETVQLDGLALAFTMAITIFCALFSGLLPSIAATRRELLGPLKENSRSVTGGPSRARLRKLLLTAEVALTVVLLIGGGLMLKSFAALRSVKLGCATSNVLTMSLSLPDVKYEKPSQRAAFFEELLGGVRAIPGVGRASVVTTVPGGGHYMDNTFKVEGGPVLGPGQFLDAVVRGADPDYFTNMNIPLVRGRIFTAEDRHENSDAMVISESMASHFFPDADPLGHSLVIDWDGAPRFEIVGIVGDVLSNLDQPAEPTMYFPLNSGRFGYGSLVVRSDRDVTALALPIQKEIARMDPELAVSDVLSMEQLIGKSTTAALFDAFLVLLFAVLALVLGAVGLYGLLSYLVTQRTNEIGIRLALGAQRSDVMGILFLDGLRPTVPGLILGLIIGSACAELIRSLLFGVQPLDAIIFVGVGLVVLLSTGLACVYPAWRAAQVDPVTALKYE
jgi:predicted permease